MSKIKKNDEVVVLCGKDRGKRGVVVGRVDDDFVVVDGVNSVKKSVKPNVQAGIVGGFVEKFMPIHISNVALFNSAVNKADRVAYQSVDGKKIRVFKSSGEIVKV